MLCVVSEDTERVLGERRLRILSELGDITAGTAPTIAEACTASLAVLQRGRRDIPFASIYLLEQHDRQARRAAFYGMVDDPGVVPELLNRDTYPQAPLWPLLASGKSQVLRGLARDFAGLFVPLEAPTPGRDPDAVLAVPLTAGGGDPVGVLFAGVSPFRALDDEYHRFIDLVAGGVSTALADARTSQDQQRRAEELAALDRAKTEFFTGVSHELRTPLTLIAGPAEDGLADLADPLSPGQRLRMEMIARNAGRLRRLVDTLLEFGRLEAGRLAPVLTPVDLAALTSDIAESFAPAAQRAGLAFHLDCPPLDSAVAVDVDMWEKIVLNLLSNAVKYTLTGGVEVRLCAGADDGVELIVTDTGIGIPAADRPLLFQRFHRVRGASGRSVEGSGIGLALVAELTALHKGSVGVDSSPGHGSTFTVTLPPNVLTEAAPQAAQASAVAELDRAEALQWSDPHQPTATDPDALLTSAPVIGDTGSRGGATVLVIEDNADLRGFLTRLLGRHYTVLEAVDGRVGLDCARDRRPDLVLTDVMMPGLDGFGVLAALRADPATATTPVIMLSARAGEEAAVEGLAAGADDYLVKPFSSHELLARVRSTLELSRLRSREGAWRAALLNALQDALVVVDPAGRIVEINDAFSAVLGYGAEALSYAPPYPWWPDPTTDPEEFVQVTRAFDEARLVGGRFVLPHRHRDGRRLWIEASAAILPDPDGDVPMTVAVFRDVTAQQRAALRDRLLADTGELLVRPAALGERLSRFTALAAPVLADLALVSLVDPDGRFRPAAATHRTNPETATTLLSLGPYVMSDTLAQDYRTGRAFVIETFTEELLASLGTSVDDLSARRALDLRSSLVVPLVADARLLGSLSFISTGIPRVHDAADRALAEELGRRVAGMVQADRVAAREHHLQMITAALAGAATVDEVASVLAAGMDDTMGAGGVAVYVARPDDALHLHLAHTLGYPPEVADAFARIHLDAHLPVADAARTRAPVWLGDDPAWRGRYPHMAVPEAADATHAVAALPLHIGEQVVGVLALSFPTARGFPPEERAFALTLAGQAAQALDRAINADARRRIADILQRGLLPPGLPDVPRLALAAHYLPAGRHAAAGGDWYDVTVLDDDHVAIAVGDVVGHGARAAAVMAQLRSALAAYLLESRSPAHALTWLSRFARGLDAAPASTAICLVLHTGTGQLRWARAGHPPPLVLDPGGEARFLDDAHGAVLGLADHPPIVEGHAELAPGATIVLYTDGLIERRGEVLDDGLDRLLNACRDDLPPDLLLSVLLEHALDGSQPGDDVAVIAARLLPGPLQQRLPAQPTQLRVLRRSVATWAHAAALPEEQAEDLQLALGEAAANAVEHAYRGREPGQFTYRIDCDPSGNVRVEVSDEGSWQPPGDPGHRGRGLMLIGKLSSDMAHHHPDSGGTTIRFTIPAPLGGNQLPPTLRRPTPDTVGQPAKLEIDGHEDRMRLRLSGDLDLAGVDPLRRALLHHVHTATRPITLDTRAITYLSSAGVGLLLEAITVAASQLALLIDPDTAAGRILSLTGLAKHGLSAKNGILKSASWQIVSDADVTAPPDLP